MAFFTQELWLLPNWAWFAIFLGVACLLILAILIPCLLIKNKKQSEDAPAEEGKSEPESKEEKKEEKKEKPVVEEKAEEPKNTATQKTTAKTEEKSAAKSTTAKSTTSKTTAKKQESASNETKVYHISKRKEDGKWQVKAEGADKALRLFFTQADAIAYAKKVAGNQEGRIVVHKEGGGFRKLNY